MAMKRRDICRTVSISPEVDLMIQALKKRLGTESMSAVVEHAVRLAIGPEKKDEKMSCNVGETP